MGSASRALDQKPLFSRQALVRLIIPLVIEQFLLTVGISGRGWSPRRAEAAIAGVSLVDNINILLIQVFAALATGGAVVVSQCLGAARQTMPGAAAKRLLYAVAVVSTVLMVLALVFRQHLLSLVFRQVEPDVMDSTPGLLSSPPPGLPFMSIYNAGAALFRSWATAGCPCSTPLIVNIINITVNAILIYGYGMGRWARASARWSPALRRR